MYDVFNGKLTGVTVTLQKVLFGVTALKNNCYVLLCFVQFQIDVI